MSENKIKKKSMGFNLQRTLNESNRSCPTCGSYSFKSVDDLYMTKFECCFKCYIQYVEGREERWITAGDQINETYKRNFKKIIKEELDVLSRRLFKTKP